MNVNVNVLTFNELSHTRDSLTGRRGNDSWHDARSGVYRGDLHSRNP